MEQRLALPQWFIALLAVSAGAVAVWGVLLLARENLFRGGLLLAIGGLALVLVNGRIANRWIRAVIWLVVVVMSLIIVAVWAMVRSMSVDGTF